MLHMPKYLHIALGYYSQLHSQLTEGFCALRGIKRFASAALKALADERAALKAHASQSTMVEGSLAPGNGLMRATCAA
eukprot:6199906-Pleurochrysis_carterae.AAC.1